MGPCRSHTGRFVIGGNGATTSAARTSRVAPLPLLPDRCRSRRQAGPRLAAVARSPPLPRGPTVVPLRFRMRWFQRSRTQTGVLGQATPVVLRTFPHPSSPEAPSLHRNYPASLVLRASPPPRRPRLTLTGSRLTRATPPAGLPVLLPVSLLSTCHRHYPGGTDRCFRRSLPGRWQPSCVSQAGRLPHYPFRGLLSVRSRCSLRTR